MNFLWHQQPAIHMPIHTHACRHANKQLWFPCHNPSVGRGNQLTFREGITFRVCTCTYTNTHTHYHSVFVSHCETMRYQSVWESLTVTADRTCPAQQQRLAHCARDRNIIITKHLSIPRVHTPPWTRSHEVPHSWSHLPYFLSSSSSHTVSYSPSVCC